MIHQTAKCEHPHHHHCAWPDVNSEALPVEILRGQPFEFTPIDFIGIVKIPVQIVNVPLVKKLAPAGTSGGTWRGLHELAPGHRAAGAGPSGATSTDPETGRDRLVAGPSRC